MLVERREVSPDRYAEWSGKGRDGEAAEAEGERQDERRDREKQRDTQRPRDRNGKKDREKEKERECADRDWDREQKAETGRRRGDGSDGESEAQLEGDELTEVGWGREPRQEGGPRSWRREGAEDLRETHTQLCSQTQV